jgi:hypothetical protein
VSRLVKLMQQLLLGCVGMGWMPVCCCAWGTLPARSHLLNGVQCCAVSTHTAADDDEVIVVLRWCCLGNNRQALGPADAPDHLPARGQQQHSQAVDSSWQGFRCLLAQAQLNCAAM